MMIIMRRSNCNALHNHKHRHLQRLQASAKWMWMSCSILLLFTLMMNLTMMKASSVHALLFQPTCHHHRHRHHRRRYRRHNVAPFHLQQQQQQDDYSSSWSSDLENPPPLPLPSIWENMAQQMVQVNKNSNNNNNNEQDNNNDNNNSNSNTIINSNIHNHRSSRLKIDNYHNTPAELQRMVQYVTILRVGIPSFFLAAISQVLYPHVSMALAHYVIHDDAGVFAVVAQDASQYIQNILTTSGLIFSILVGQTYYFMYQQQEAIYLALFDEVTVAKSLLEQVALVCQGRDVLYHRILTCIDTYVQHDLTQFQTEPAVLLSRRPVDDPLEDILYLTSVGEPSIIYSTVRSLRQARAARLGALQRKLPNIHMILLWSLALIVLFTFPLLGAAVQTIGGMGILKLQAWYLSFIVFGISMTLGVINELREPEGRGAYNVVTVLAVMVQGLEEELQVRLQSKNDGSANNFMPGPSVDPDHPAFFTVESDDEARRMMAMTMMEEDEEDIVINLWQDSNSMSTGRLVVQEEEEETTTRIVVEPVVVVPKSFWKSMFHRRRKR